MQSYVVFLVYSGHKKLLLSLLSHIDPVQTILGLVKGSEFELNLNLLQFYNIHMFTQ